MGEAVTIYSREEALAMRPEARPICHRIPSEVYHGIWEHVGAATMCWNPKPEGVFDVQKAEKVAMDLCFLIAEQFEKHGIILLQSTPGPDNQGSAAAVPQSVHTTSPQQGNRDQPGFQPNAGEKTSCTAAASNRGSSLCQTGHTSHTPSIFAAPTQFLETADARGPVATPDKNGI